MQSDKACYLITATKPFCNAKAWKKAQLKRLLNTYLMPLNGLFYWKAGCFPKSISSVLYFVII